jgi:hypothetical protein
MTKLKTMLMCAAVAGLLTGCSGFKNPFGGNDDTVLPGEREEVLPPEQQTARDPVVTGDQPAEPVDASTASTAGPITDCDPSSDPDCVQPIDQEAGSTGVQ